MKQIKTKWIHHILNMKNVANKSFKSIKLRSCIIDLKWRHLLSRVSHHTSVKFYIVSKLHMYLSQNNACKLNNYQHLLDKKRSTCHRKRFCLRNSIPSTINFNFKHWMLYSLLGTFTSEWCDRMCAWSMTSDRLTNQRVAYKKLFHEKRTTARNAIRLTSR